MRIQLPDVNMLIALHDATHQGHERAHQQNGGTLVTLDMGITVAAIVSPHTELIRRL